MKRGILCIAFLIAWSQALLADPKGDEIADKSFGLPEPSDTTSVGTMLIVDSSGSRRHRKFEMQFKKLEGMRSAEFFRFVEPADVAGTKFLSLKGSAGSADQRLYLPSLNKTRKIALESKSGDFVNSDLSFYDLEKRDYEDATYLFLAENQTIADKAFEGKRFYKIEMRLKDAHAPYAKVIAWIGMDDYVRYRLQAFDKSDDSLWKTISFVKVEKIGQYHIPTQILAVNHKRGSKTLLQLSDIRVDVGIPSSVFTEKNLEQ